MSFGWLQNLISKHKLACILAVGIVVRLVLMPISAHPFDMYVWYNLSGSILKNGPFYLQGFPPLWYHYMMVPVAYSYSWLSSVLPSGAIAMSSLPSALDFYPSYSVAVVPGLLFDFVVKVPFLVSDVLVAVLLYKVVGEVSGNRRLGESAAVLWFLNPFVIWISAGWGMWDTLPALFSLASVYLLVKKRFAFSGVCLALGVAAKLYPVLFLVPIAFYIYKFSSAGERLKNFGGFYGVFGVVSLLLFLPYLGAVASFIGDFFLLGSGGAGLGVVTPLGPSVFGLTYWSALGSLLNASVISGFVTLISVVSLVLFVAFLVLAYWYSSRLSFKNPLFDLCVVMLFSVAAFFLSYRIVCEQWFVWALPFLVVLCVVGRIRKAFVWAISIVALLYVFMNCPVPFFFLPLSPWLSGELVGLVHFVWWIEPVRLGLLVVLAAVFSLLMLVFVWRLNKKFEN